MNTLEKAHLIRELDQLIYDLEHRALTMFETARAKHRIKDIFERCDQPVFHKQILEYRSLTQPDIAVAQYVAQTSYQLSFRGFFYNEQDLEQVLYQYPEYGWAMLYRPRQGWQIWLIPAKYKTALISDWGSIHSNDHWFEEQIELYNCLNDDLGLKAQAAQLKETKTSRRQKVKTLMANTAQSIEPKTEYELNSQANAATPQTHFEWQQWQFKPIEHHYAAALNLIRYALEPEQSNSAFLDIYRPQHWTSALDQQPIFLAEQINDHGAFSGYVLLLGYQDRDQLLEHAATFEQYGFYLSSIHPCEIDQLQQHWQQLESLFYYYDSLSDVIWQSHPYSAFIPRPVIQGQKIIHFEEAHAHIHTPVLLLKERDKLRMIHGQNRLYLNSYELALPFILLNREDGFSWQLIKQVVSELSQPIEVHHLHQALLQSKNDNSV